MKSLLIILLFLGNTCFSQSDTAWLGERIKLPINYEQLANFDFEKALKGDYELSVPIKQPKPRSVILSAQLLCGGWKAEALGDNWGGFPRTLVNPNKRLVFQKDSIFFYHNDTLARATTFRIVVASADSVRHGRTLIELGDSRELWRITLYQIDEHVPWHGIATKLYLLFNKELNCICGCPEELYSQEAPF